MRIRRMLPTLVCGLSLLFSSCSMPFSNVEDLMQAPRLSESQTAVYDALSRSIGTDQFVLKYPKSGKYRSAFVFYDIDQDNIDEAIVFYQLDSDVSSGTRINILDMRNGQWKSVYDVSGEEDSEVEYIQFESIESADKKNILIGWSTASPQTTQMSIYRYETGITGAQLVNASDSITHEEYEQSIIRDIDNDGLTDIILLSRRRSNSSYHIQLISSVNGSIDQMDTLSFSQNINGVFNMIWGRLDNVQQALFLDVALSNSFFATEILTIQNKQFVPLIFVSDAELENPNLLSSEWIGETKSTEDKNQSSYTRNAVEPIEEVTPAMLKRDNFLSTLRAEEILSADLNGDGIIEVPSTRPMPGYEFDEEELDEIRDEDLKHLTTLSNYRNGVMTPIMSGCTNLQAGYFLRFPDRWKNIVTVYSENNLSQWSFIKYQGNFNDLSSELLRIRRISKNDFQDRLETHPILLNPDQSGPIQFYGYLPLSAEEDLAITEEELLDMFFLL